MQYTNKINPSAVHTPIGFRRLKYQEPLRDGDMFFHCSLMEWLPAHVVLFKENYYTNCIRPIRLLAEKCL